MIVDTCMGIFFSKEKLHSYSIQAGGTLKVLKKKTVVLKIALFAFLCRKSSVSIKKILDAYME